MIFQIRPAGRNSGLHICGALIASRSARTQISRLYAGDGLTGRDPVTAPNGGGAFLWSQAREPITLREQVSGRRVPDGMFARPGNGCGGGAHRDIGPYGRDRRTRGPSRLGASLSALPGSSCRIMVASPRAARPQPGLEGRGGGLIRVRRGGGNETGSAYRAGRVREWRAWGWNVRLRDVWAVGCGDGRGRGGAAMGHC
jgi:hypothetical protein